MHNTGDKLALDISVSHTMQINDSLRRCRHQRPCSIQRRFNFADFIDSYRRSGITFDATGTTTSREITAEWFGQDVRGDEHTTDLEYGG
jgi:hypothetical protein